MSPQVEFVRVSDRRWLVEETGEVGGLATITLAGIDDDASGEQAEIVWDAELDKEILNQDDWPSLLGATPEEPATFSAYLRTITWNTASAADDASSKRHFARVFVSTPISFFRFEKHCCCLASTY